MSIRTRKIVAAAALALTAALSAVGVATHAGATSSHGTVVAGGGDHWPALPLPGV